MNGIDSEHLTQNVLGKIAREEQRRFRHVVGGRHPLDLGRTLKVDRPDSRRPAGLVMQSAFNFPIRRMVLDFGPRCSYLQNHQVDQSADSSSATRTSGCIHFLQYDYSRWADRSTHLCFKTVSGPTQSRQHLVLF